ncbi:MAG TPA: hypothetical protein VKT19_03120, partial [Steroidobacteraceae bacterium]|nr:hypothetical protein [Steroidobacteraceae bacterium]
MSAGTVQQRRRLPALPRVALVMGLSLAAALALWPGPARADLSVTITKGVTDPVPIAVVPFGEEVGATGGGTFDVAAIVQQDLGGSGRFRPMPREQMHMRPTLATQVQAADWRAVGNDYVLVGRVTSPAAGSYNVDCELINTSTGQTIGTQRIVASPASLRNAAHRVSDFVYQRI